MQCTIVKSIGAEILTCVSTQNILNPMYELLDVTRHTHGLVEGRRLPASFRTQNPEHGAFHYLLSNKWLTPSKLLASPLEAKLPENGLQPRRLVGVPLLPEGSRSLTDIALALLRSMKSATTKKAQTSLSARCHSNVLSGQSYRIKSARFSTS